MPQADKIWAISVFFVDPALVRRQPRAAVANLARVVTRVRPTLRLQLQPPSNFVYSSTKTKQPAFVFQMNRPGYNSISVDTEGRKRAARATYKREWRAQNAAAAAAAAASASSPASSSPAAAASPADASPGAGRSLEDEDGYHIGDLLQQNKSRDDIKARMAAATVAKKAKAAAKRAAAALPAPGTRRSPACCPLLTLI